MIGELGTHRPSILSHITPRAPKRLVFSNQPLQLFTDLEKIHRELDQGEMRGAVVTDEKLPLMRKGVQRFETAAGKPM